MFFLELSCFFYNPMDVANLISGSSALAKIQLEHLEVHSSLTVEACFGEFLSITLLVCEMSAIVW